MKTTRGAGTTAKHAGTAKHVATKKHAPAKTKAKTVTHKKATVHAKAKKPAHAKAKALAAGDAFAVCTIEALAASLRSQGLPVTDSDVLGLFRLAGGDDDKGMPIRAALEAASEYGLAGLHPCWTPLDEPVSACGLIDAGEPGLGVHEAIGCAAEEARGVTAREDAPHAPLAGPVGAQFGLTSAHGLILGVELPGQHTVLATPDGWWSWGKLWCPCEFPDAVIDEAWAVTWT